MLRGVVTGVEVFDGSVVVKRSTADSRQPNAYHEKGGRIDLMWEVEPQKMRPRSIFVSRERAQQAMQALSEESLIC